MKHHLTARVPFYALSATFDVISKTKSVCQKF